MIKNFIFRRHENKASLMLTKEAIDDMNTQIKMALNSIHKQTKKKAAHQVKALKNKPWVLLIGPQGAGKTTLLAKSGFNFESPTNKSLNHITNTQGIDWWISEAGVFIDPAAKYCLSTNETPNEKLYWQRFLKRIAKKHTPLFASVCLVIDLISLIQPDKVLFENLINRIKLQIQELSKHDSSLCINIIITQCDYMSGFAEFFSSLTIQEQNEMFGFCVFDPTSQTHVNDLFLQRFKHLVYFLNLNLRRRLHHEPNTERRTRALDFIFQFEELMNPLYQIVSSISDNTFVVINNIFFCSAKQTHTPINLFAKKLNCIFQIENNKKSPLITKEQPRFIHNMLIKLTTRTLPLPKKLPSSRWQIILYPAVSATLLALAFAFHYIYQKNMTAMKKITNNLENINTTNWLSTLDFLSVTKDQINKFNLTPSHLTGFNQVYSLKKSIYELYHYYIANQFIQYLNQALANEIKIDINNNSPDLYKSLQVYLMISNPHQLDPTFVSAWFKDFWKAQLPNRENTQNKLNFYLKEALQSKIISWYQDKHLIENAKQTLQQQSLAQIAFKMLRNASDFKNTFIEGIESVQGINIKNALIPSFYSKNQFSKIYETEIPKLGLSIEKGSWILGKMSSPQDIASLIAAMRKMYLQHYINQWQDILTEIKLTNPKTFAQAQKQINLLTNPESPLLQIYQQAINTTIKVNATLLNETLSSYMPGHPNATPMIETLVKLQDDLKSIEEAPSIQIASFEFAKKRMDTNGKNDSISNALTTANTMPAPLKQWILTIAHNSWKLILEQSRLYLNALWQANVVPMYNKTIKSRYPVFNSEEDNIRVNDFNHFFGSGGTMQTFFTQHLMPFVNMSDPYWTWKTLDDAHINIPQSFLDMLIRASMIQKMFYTNDSSTPSIQFELTPLNLSKNINQFILNIGGQMVRCTPQSKKSALLKWPGPDGNFVTMRFNDKNESYPTFTTLGPWAWLRLLDESTITPTDNTKDYKLNFHIKNNQASYQLKADNAINPYLPNVISGFRLPKSL